MRRLSLVGVGAGDPRQVTLEAADVLATVDVLLVQEKPGGRSDLAVARERLAAAHCPQARVLHLPDAERDRSDLSPGAYADAVADWRTGRAAIWDEALATQVTDGEHAAVLVWGDPALYDSTMWVAERLTTPVEWQVVPGVSSVATLCARHRVAVNRVGRPFQVTTGRLLRDVGWPTGVDDLVVMLDASCSFSSLDPAGVEIFWGAYLGTDDELLVAGPLGAVADRIRTVRAEARERHGWVMDTYLLRR